MSDIPSLRHPQLISLYLFPQLRLQSEGRQGTLNLLCSQGGQRWKGSVPADQNEVIVIQDSDRLHSCDVLSHRLQQLGTLLALLVAQGHVWQPEHWLCKPTHGLHKGTYLDKG